MSPPLSRRRLLSLTGVSALVAVGGTLVHAYTGPIALGLQNLTTSTVTTRVVIDGPRRTVFDETFEVPPARNDEPGRITREAAIDNGVRGTEYRVSVRLPGSPVDPVDASYTATCTGFSDIGDRRISDHVGVDILGQSAPDRILVDGSACSSAF